MLNGIVSQCQLSFPVKTTRCSGHFTPPQEQPPPAVLLSSHPSFFLCDFHLHCSSIERFKTQLIPHSSRPLLLVAKSPPFTPNFKACYYRIKDLALAGSTMLTKPTRASSVSWFLRSVQAKHISSGGRRPKKKIYHRVHELDRVMNLRKKPSLVLHLKSIIQSQKQQCLLLRDLEKQVGFVQKWNLMAIIEKYPSIFRVGGGIGRALPFVTLTEKAWKLASEEAEARKLMEPIVVKNLRKLLMLSIDCRVRLEHIEFIGNELGLPLDFKDVLIPKYPEYFSVKTVNGKPCLQLENWDSTLAITAREERLALEGISGSNPPKKKVRISKDGNFSGPFAFKMCFAAGFRPNASFLDELERWQRMEFPSPYLNARRFEASDPKARKRTLGVLHELLSLTMEKRLTSLQLDAFHCEYLLPARLLLCLVKNHGVFYITNKGVRSSVFLKEAYSDSCLIDKCPLLVFQDKFVALTGRKETNLCNEMQL